MASNRRRLGVAVLLDPPVSDEVDGLRRAVGDPSLGRIPPHVTLVPPVNVRRADLHAAVDRVRRAAAATPREIHLTLGAVTTFLPDNPVLYLAVGGDLHALRGLRDAVFAPPLERSLSWPWVPHVTLADGAPEDRIRGAVEALSGYTAVVPADRVVLLEERAGRVWLPLADADFGPAVRIGTGGLTLELTTGRVPDPILAEALGDVAPRLPRDGVGLLPPVVVTAHREGLPIGAALAGVDRAGPRVDISVGAQHRGQGVGSHLLAHLEHVLRVRGWDFPVLRSTGPAGFYAARSRWVVGTQPDGAAEAGYSKATEA